MKLIIEISVLMIELFYAFFALCTPFLFRHSFVKQKRLFEGASTLIIYKRHKILDFYHPL